MLTDFIRPDVEALERVRAKRGYDGDIGGVAALRDQHTPDPRHVVPSVKGIPPAADIGFKPRGKIRDTVGWRSPHVAQVTRTIARWNVQTAAKGDGEVRVVATDSCARVEGSPGRHGVVRILIIKGDTLMNIVADRLNARPSRLGLAE